MVDSIYDLLLEHNPFRPVTLELGLLQDQTGTDGALLLSRHVCHFPGGLPLTSGVWGSAPPRKLTEIVVGLRGSNVQCRR